MAVRPSPGRMHCNPCTWHLCEVSADFVPARAGPPGSAVRMQNPVSDLDGRFTESPARVAKVADIPLLEAKTCARHSSPSTQASKSSAASNCQRLKASRCEYVHRVGQMAAGKAAGKRCSHRDGIDEWSLSIACGIHIGGAGNTEKVYSMVP